MHYVQYAFIGHYFTTVHSYLYNGYAITQKYNNTTDIRQNLDKFYIIKIHIILQTQLAVHKL